MAVGDVLREPLTGYTRIDERDNNITYERIGVQSTNSNFFANTYTSFPVGATIKFNFKGTALKIIGYCSNLMRVYLDSDEYIEVAGYNSTTPKIILYEVEGLKDTEHSVIMENAHATTARIDAIDILGDVKLLPYNNKAAKKKNLFQSNNKTYSLESIAAVMYETKMVSNTSPAPLVISASSINSTTYDAWRAFSGADTTIPYLSKAYAIQAWIQIDYGVAKKMNVLSMLCNNSAVENFPKEFSILGSNDGVTFTKLADIKNQVNWFKGETRTYNFSNNAPFKIYRLDVKSINGATNFVSISNLTYGYEKRAINQIPSVSTDNFINYGSENKEGINKVYIEKNYILQDVSSEDVDGLWKTQINRKPLNMKFE